MPKSETGPVNADHTTAADAVLESYRSRHADLAGRFAASVRRSSLVRLAMLCAVAALLYTVVQAGRGAYPLRVSAVPLIVLITLLLWFLRLLATQDRLARLVALYERALARVRGDVSPVPLPTGEDLRPEHHLFERDLSILGPNSLFEMLATVRTGLGQRGLADLLLRPSLSIREIRERQETVLELAPQNDLRERIALLGATNAQQLPATHFDAWLTDPTTTFPRAATYVLGVLSVLLVAGLMAGASHRMPWSALAPNLLLLAAVQSGVAAQLRRRVLPILAQAGRLQAQLMMLRDGLVLMRQLPASSAQLRALQDCIPALAPTQLRRLHSLFAIAEQRTKEYFFVFSLLVAAGTQTAIAVERWRQEHGRAMAEWIAAWSRFEALNAMATFAHEHPDYPFPTLMDPEGTRATFAARDLAHPLLPSAVGNDVELNGETRFLVISGSNMAGKSTLLRAIGINVVLALAGGPVRADSLRLTPVALGASIALADSLAEGRSKFRAEVERLRDLVELSESADVLSGRAGVLFLIDEILSGTNSVDRQQASDSILRALLERGAIGALSTHDLALTVIADDVELHGRNVHMASSDAADPLAFDYLLKAGPNTRSSAQAILRLLGL